MMDREAIYQAIRKADAAGDAQAVRSLGAYLQKMDTPKPGMIESGIRGGADGFMFGFDDEAMGLKDAAGTGIYDPVTTPIMAAGRYLMDSDGTKKRYTATRDSVRDQKKLAQDTNPGSYFTGNIIGAIANPVPLGKGKAVVSGVKAAKNASILARAMKAIKATSPAGAAMGGLYGLGSGEGDAASQLGTTGLYAAGGAVAAPVLSGFGKVAQDLLRKSGKIRPKGRIRDKDVQTLQKEGVLLTPGQIMGGFGRKAEESMKSSPFLGNRIQDLEEAGVREVNAAATNRGLAPLGKRLPDNIPIGRESAEFAQDAINSGYDDAFKGTSTELDDLFLNDLMASVDEAAPVAAIDGNVVPGLTRKITQMFADGPASGEQMSAAKNLTSRIKDNRFNPLTNDGISMARGAIIDAVGRQNPGAGPAIRNADQAYRILSKVKDAQTRAGGEVGVATPAQLLAAVRKGDMTAGKRKTWTGDADLQDLADAAVNVMGNRVADSGTAGRTQILSLLTPQGLMKAAPAIALRPIYSEPVLRMINKAPASVQKWTQTAEQLAQRAGVAKNSPARRAARRAIERHVAELGVILPRTSEGQALASELVKPLLGRVQGSAPALAKPEEDKK